MKTNIDDKFDTRKVSIARHCNPFAADVALLALTRELAQCRNNI